MMICTKRDAGNNNVSGLLPCFLPVLILLITALQSGLASDPVVVDNGDCTFTATWDFNDLTNYTLSNLTVSNEEVNLTIFDYHWNQSTAHDFSEGQGSNVVGGDGIVVNTDYLVLGYLQDQCFVRPDTWNYTNGTDSKVISQWSSAEEGHLYRLYPKNITIKMSTIQPDSFTGIDTYIDGGTQLTNYGGVDTLRIEKGGSERRALIWFDVSSLADTKVIDAQLNFYFYSSEDATSLDISAHRITNSWAEMSTSWQKRDAFTDWTTLGGDFDPVAADTVTGLTNNFGWKSWNITSVVDDWINGKYENNGVLLLGSIGSNTWKLFHSSDHVVDSLRPRINVTYYPLNTFNETATISQSFPLLDPGALKDSSVADFEQGECYNTTITPAGGGEVTLGSTGYYKFETMDDITDWQVDPFTNKNSGSFQLSSTTFYEGTGSMQLDYHLASTNQDYGVMRTTGTYWDWSKYTGLVIWGTSSGQGEVMKVILEDTWGTFWESSPYPLTSSWLIHSLDLTDFPGDISSIDAIKLHFSDTTLNTTTYVDNVTLIGGSPYFPDGNFTSRAIDGGYAVQWETILWEEDKPAGTDIAIRTRTGNSSTPDASWSGWSSPYPSPEGSDITNPEGRYIQYRLFLNTTDSDYTPSVSEVKLIKSEYNLTVTYLVDAFENATWAKIFLRLNEEIIWEKVVTGTSSAETVAFDIGKYLYNVGDNSIEFGLIANANSTTNVNISVFVDDFQIKGFNGFYTSKSYDAGSEAIWGQVSWDADFPSNTDIILSTRTSLDNFTWSSWSAPLAFNKDDISSPVGRYIQYQAIFKTQTLGITPILKDINITYRKYADQGTVTFNTDLVAENVTNWGILTSLSLLRGQSITFEYSIDSGANWYLVPSDGNLSVVITSTNKIRFKAILYALNTSLTPTLYSMNLTFCVNRPPTIIGVVPNQSHSEDGGPLSIDLTLYESDYEDGNNYLRWFITGENNSLYAVDGEYSADDVITFTPLPDAYGNDEVVLWLEDSFGAKASQTLWINITPVNDAPEIRGVIPSFDKYENDPNWQLDLSGYKHDMDSPSSELSWSAFGWDPALFDSVSIAGDIITFDLATDAYGNDEITIVLNDMEYAVSQKIWVNVTLINKPPVINGIIPNFDRAEDDPTWIVDLTSYETDREDPYPSEDLFWSIFGVNNSLLSVSLSDNNITFTLLPDTYGNNELMIVLTDSYGAIDSQNIWVNVTPSNDPPNIFGIIPNFEKNEDAANWNYDLSIYKYDVDNSTSDLFWSVIGWDTALFDSVSVVGEIIIFDLAPDAYGDDEITIILSDGLLTDSQNIWVNITPLNDAPVIVGMIPDFDKSEDDTAWTFNLTSYESDIENVYPSASLSWSILGINPDLLSVTISDNNLTFTLKPDAYGNNEITIILTDSGGLTDSQIVWVNVTPINDAPEIVGIIPSFEKNEDSLNWGFDLSGYKYDVDNLSSELSWQIVGWDPLLFDSVTLAGDVITFDLVMNAYGNDEITIILSDGLLTDFQNIWVNITPVNDAPLIIGTIPDFDKNEDDTAWTINLTSYESDIEDMYPSASLTWIVTGVDSYLLSVTISDNNLTFTLKPDAYGNNEITIILTDSEGITNSQNIWVNITPMNDAPEIVGIIPDFEKNEDAANWNFDLSGYRYDVDNLSSELSWQIVGWGTTLFDSVGIVGNVITFDLALNAYGNDDITIILSDGEFSDSQDVWVYVNPMNDPPTIIGIISDFDKNEDDLSWTLELTSYESDIEDGYPSASLTWSVAGVNSDLLSVAISDNNLTFTLKPDAYGDDEITIILTDSYGATDSQNIWINVMPENDAPNIAGVIPDFDKEEDATNWNIDLSPYKFDVDNTASELSWGIAGWNSALFDSVSLAGNVLTFDLALNAYGNDEITITLSDGNLYDSQNFWVNVMPVNDAPIIVNTIPNIQKLEDSQSWTLDLTAYESDTEDGSPSASLTWSVSDVDNSLISITISDNSLTFTLVPDAFGNDYITIILTDSGGLTDSQGVWVEITSVNDAPIIQSTLPNIVLNEDTSTSISLRDYGSDVEDTPDQLRWTLTDTNESLYSWQIDPVTHTLYVDPLPNAYGTNIATLTLIDKGGATATRPLQVLIISVNDPPYIYPEVPQSFFDTLEDEPIVVILTGFENDVEDPNDLLTWEVSGVDTSIIRVSLGSENDELIIVPVVEFSPDDTESIETQITLLLADSEGLSAQQDVTVTIIPVNNAPVIDELPDLIIKYDKPYVFDLSPYVFDEDTQKDQLIVTTSEPSEDAGKGYIKVDGLRLTFEYPESRIGKPLSVLIALSDGQLSSYTIMQVTISDHSPPQLSSPIPDVNFDEDSYINGAFDLDDHFIGFEGDPPNSSYYLHYTHHGGEYVFVFINKNNTVDFSAAQDWFGVEWITFRAEDTYGAWAEHTIEVTVNPVNDPPVISDLPDQECKVNVSKVLDIGPYISDVDTPKESLIIGTNSLYINTTGHTLIFFYDNVTRETVNIIVSDGSSQNSITIKVTASPNSPPSISALPELMVRGGEVYLFSLLPYVGDKDNEIEELQIWTDSDYIDVNPSDNMLLQIDFSTDMVGYDEIVTLFISDGLDSNSTDVLIHITDVLIPKLLSNLPNLFFAEDTVFSNAINLNDYFENVFGYQILGNESVNITIQNGWATLSAAENWTGSETITFRGVLGDAFVEDTIEVTVKPVNDPPILHPLPTYDKKVNEIWVLNLLDYIEDIDTPITDIIVSVDSPHVILYSLNVYFQYPFEIYDEVTVTVSDGENSVYGILIVNVTAVNNAPIYMGLQSTYHFNPRETWSIDLDDYFYDVDGDYLIFSCNREEVVIDPITHTASWTPEEGENSLEDVVFSANDGYVTIDSSPIDLLVNVQKSEPSFWEAYWWLILLIALLTSAVIAFALMKRKEEEEEEIEYTIPVDKAVEYLASEGGGNYLIKSETSETAYKVFSGLLQSGFEGMCITTKPPEDLTKRYDLGKAWIIKLALRGQKTGAEGSEETKMMGLLALGDEEREEDKYMFSSNFQRIVETIEDFITGGDHKVVLLDGLEYILGGEELIMYIGFIASLRERLKDRNSCLLIPIDPKTLSDKELGLLERETLSLGKELAESTKRKHETHDILEHKEGEDVADVAGVADVAETEDELPPPPPNFIGDD